MMIGTTIAGRYEVAAQLGVGGMGVVYRAHDTTLRRDVALKVIAPHTMQDDAARSRFLREAQALAGLSHPNIVTIHDLAEDPATRTVFIVMELLRGASLRQRMADSTRPAFSEMASQVCRALEAAHARGILHRDIKPENIFVCEDGTLKLMDFGLARLLGSASSNQSSMVAGTLAYMAPEQLRGEKLDERADLYSLGVLFYEYLSGETPFAGDNPGTVLLKHLSEPPPPLRDRLPALPVEIESMVLRLLEKKPEDRFPTVAALHEALDTPTPSGNSTSAKLADALASLPYTPLPVPPTYPEPTLLQPEPTTPVVVPTRPAVSAPMPERGAGSGRWLAGAAVGVLLLITGFLFARVLQESSSRADAKRETITLNHARITSGAESKPGETKKKQAAQEETHREHPEAATKTSSGAKNKNGAAASEARSLELLRALKEQEASIAALKKEIAAYRAQSASEQKKESVNREAQPMESAPSSLAAPIPPGVPPQEARERPTGSQFRRAPRNGGAFDGFPTQDEELRILGVRSRRDPKTVHLSIENRSERYVYFFAIEPETGKAVRLNYPGNPLTASSGLRNLHRFDLMLPETLASSPERLLVVASKRELTEIPGQIPIPSLFLQQGMETGLPMPQRQKASRLLREQVVLAMRSRQPELSGERLPARDVLVRMVRLMPPPPRRG